MDNPLILFTNFYPFSHQEAFLETEVPYLAKAFSRVIIIPHECEGRHRKLPENVTVERSFSDFFSRPKWRQALPRLWRVRRQWHEMPVTLNFDKMKYYLSYCSMAEVYCDLLNQYILNNPHLQDAQYYSYWFFAQTSGIALYKKRYYPQLQLTTRAHGYDLYEELSPYETIPLRPNTLEQITSLLPISEYGKHYIKKKYPSADPCTYRLGVEDPRFTNLGSKEDTFTILSCSNLIDIKRVPLIISSLKLFAKKKKQLKVIWHHIGDGPERQNLLNFAREELGQTVKWKFHGNIPHEHVYPFYRKFGIDLFIHMSQSEGIPVSIMEAYACGIPAVAASVGGIPEIVNRKNGILLGKNPFPEEITHALEFISGNPHLRRSLQKGAKETWRTQFAAESNFPAFIDKMKRVS